LEDVAEFFSNPEYSKLLSATVVENGRPLGVISRYRFMDIYLKRYARELHGKRPIRAFINNTPLLWNWINRWRWPPSTSRRNMQFPLTEDFIVISMAAIRRGFRDGSAESDGATDAGQHGRAGTGLLAASSLRSWHLVQSENDGIAGADGGGIAHEINTPLGYVQNNVAIGQDLFSKCSP